MFKRIKKLFKSSQKKTIKELTLLQFEALEKINNLNKTEFNLLLLNGKLSSYEKELVFDLLSLFNSLELNFNKKISANKSNSFSGITAILNDEDNPDYKKIFSNEKATSFKKTLKNYIEIRNLIAHNLVKKHDETNSILFFSANKKEWNRQVKTRLKNKDQYLERLDSDVALSEMEDEHLIFAVLYVPVLEHVRSLLIPIEKYFSESIDKD